MRIEAFRPDGEVRRYFGVYPAIVTSIVRDSDNLGRIEVKFPWLGSDGADVRALATLCTPYADDDQGFEMIPAVDTQVVVAFEAGDLRRPYVIGACWNGSESLPEPPAQPNDKRLIRTRAGSLLEFDDRDVRRPGAVPDAGHEQRRVVVVHARRRQRLVNHDGSPAPKRLDGRCAVVALDRSCDRPSRPAGDARPGPGKAVGAGDPEV